MLKLITLGRLSLGDGERQLLTGRRKVLALLAYLARREGQQVGRSVLADLLWPDVDEPRSKQSLRTALTELRAAVGDAVIADADTICVPRGGIALDVALMAAAIERRELVEATNYWHGDFLTGLEDLGNGEWRAWLEAERLGARRQLDWAFERLLAECQSSGRWSEAVTHADRWVALRPGHEVATSHLIACLRSVGRTADALARHAALNRTLLEANGAPPSAAFSALASTLGSDVPLRPGVRGLLTPDLVGRENELGLLTAAWARVSRGEGCCVIVDGDDGLGKTRLLDEFGRTVRTSKRAVVLQSRAFASERDHSASLIRTLLEQLADAPGLAGVPASALATLGTVSERIRERFPADEPRDESVPESFSRAVADVAFERPVAVLVDDAANGDPASLQVLERIMRRPPPNVLIVVTGRLDAWDRWPAITELGGAAHVSRIVLASLSLEQSRRMIASVGPMDPAVVEALSVRLHSDTHGRPGAIEALLRGLADAGALTPDATGRWTLTSDVATLSIPVPDEVSSAMRARLTGLADDTRRVLECAAVIGPRVEESMLEVVAALPAPRYRAATADLFSRRLLRHAPAIDGRVEFPGEAERRAVYDQIVPSARRVMHRAVGRALRGAATSAEQREAIREHDRLAGGTGSRRLVMLGTAAAVLTAGAIAIRAMGPGEATMPLGTQVLLANVQNLTSDSSLGATLDLAARVGLQQSTQVRLFPPTQVRETIARMRRDAPAAGLDERLAQEIAVRENLPAFIHLAIAAVDSSYVITGRVVDPHESRDLFSTDARATGRSEILPSLDGVLGRIRTALGESRLAMRGERSLPLVTTSSLDALRFYVAGNRAWTMIRLADAKSAWTRAIELDSSFALAHASMGMYYYVYGDSGIDRARGDYYYDRALANAGRLTERERIALDASVASMRGLRDDAIAKQRLLAERYPERDTWHNLGSSLMRARRLDEAAVALRRAIAMDSTFANAWVNLATVYSIAGRTDSALRAYDKAAATGAEYLTVGGNVNQEWGAVMVRAGRVAAAESLYSRASRKGQATDRALAFRSLGWLAIYRGRYREAIAALEEAVALSQTAGGLSAARNRWILASVLLEIDESQRARSELTRALAALGSLETDPVFLFYLAETELRAGNVPAAVKLQDRIDRTARRGNAVDGNARAYMHGLMALAEGERDTAIAWARRADASQQTAFFDLILSRAYDGLGVADSAIAAAERLESRWQFGFEAQFPWRHAGLRVARLSLQAGDTARARAALERQMEVWREADADFPDLTECRRLLGLLTKRR